MDKLEPMHELMEMWRYSSILISGFGLQLRFDPIVPMASSMFKIHHFYTFAAG